MLRAPSFAAGDRSGPSALAAVTLGRWRAVDWLCAAAVLLLVAALVSVWRARAHSRRARIVWTVVVIVLPIVGPLAWFATGRERRRGPPPPA